MTSGRGFLRITVAAVFAAALPALAAPSCDTMDPCAAKACRLDAEIAVAKAKGNAKVLAGLERTRAELTHCSDDGLKQKRKVALEQAQRRIDQRETELKNAEATGNATKIKTAERKLAAARKAYADMEKAPL
jgi:hypothetical protein